MKNSESLKEFKKLNSDQITEKIGQLRKEKRQQKTEKEYKREYQNK